MLIFQPALVFHARCPHSKAQEEYLTGVFRLSPDFTLVFFTHSIKIRNQRSVISKKNLILCKIKCNPKMDLPKLLRIRRSVTAVGKFIIYFQNVIGSRINL